MTSVKFLKLSELSVFELHHTKRPSIHVPEVKALLRFLGLDKVLCFDHNGTFLTST